MSRGLRVKGGSSGDGQPMGWRKAYSILYTTVLLPLMADLFLKWLSAQGNLLSLFYPVKGGEMWS